MDLGDSAPRRCSQVSPDTTFFGVMTVMDLASIHLKKFKCVGAGVGDVISTDGSLQNAEMTDEINSKGRWHGIQEQRNCGLLYLREKESNN